MLLIRYKVHDPYYALIHRVPSSEGACATADAFGDVGTPPIAPTGEMAATPAATLQRHLTLPCVAPYFESCISPCRLIVWPTILRKDVTIHDRSRIFHTED